MGEEIPAATLALAARSTRDVALDAALERLAPGRLPERRADPDLPITAVRRPGEVSPS